MRVLYSIGIALYVFAIRIASLYHPKARAWIQGRKSWVSVLRKKLLETKWDQKNERVWIHCASLGEFEQGRPLLELIREKYPDAGILLTFFSPSGFDAKKNYDKADVVLFLPSDLPGNVSSFLDLVTPTQAIFIKYEFWFNYLAALKQRNIPHYLVSGIFRPGQVFFRFYGRWFLRHLRHFRMLFLQDEDSERLLSVFGISNTTICGDTRLDRVIRVAAEPFGDPVIESFLPGNSVIIAGSTWEPDEKVLLEFLQQDTMTGRKLILAPHEISESRLSSIESRFKEFSPHRHSRGVHTTSSRLLIIDHVGSLSRIYRYGSWCYIGGGFGNGIHNVTEAAVYGKPVFFGPVFHKFREAMELVIAGGAFSVNDAQELGQKIRFLESDMRLLQMAGMVSKEFILRNSGATEKIFHGIFP